MNSPYAHQTAEYPDLDLPWLARRCERFLLCRADRVLTVSAAQRDYLISLGARPDRTHVAPNGVDFDRFDHRTSGDDVRNALGLGDRKVVGFIGGLRHHHGIEIVLEALRELGDEAPIFLVVGEGRDRSAIEDAIQRLGTDRVILTGGIPREEVPRYIAAMDIAVKPTSNFYCCPLKILEYMAMKVPVLAGYSPSVAEVVENQVTGRVIATEPEAFRDAILDLLHDPPGSTAMAARAFQAIEGRSWTSNAQDVLHIMDGSSAEKHGEPTP